MNFRYIHEIEKKYDVDDIILKHYYKYNENYYTETKKELNNSNSMYQNNYLVSYIISEDYDYLYPHLKYMFERECDVIVNSVNVLNSFFLIGKSLFNKYKKKNKSFTINDICLYYFDITRIEETKDLYNNFIIENGYPFTIEYAKQYGDKYTTCDFILNALLIYAIKQYLLSYRKLDDMVDEENEVEPYYKKHKTLCEKLESILKIQFSDSLINYTHYTFDDGFENPIEYLHKDDDGFDLVRLLIIYINNERQRNLGMCHSFEHDVLIFDKENELFHMYPRANSLIGIAYNRLLHDLLRSDYAPGMKKCALDNCNKWFAAKNNRNYCDIHVGTAEAAAHKNKLYYEKNKHNKKKKVDK